MHLNFNTLLALAVWVGIVCSSSVTDSVGVRTYLYFSGLILVASALLVSLIGGNRKIRWGKSPAPDDTAVGGSQRCVYCREERE